MIAKYKGKKFVLKGKKCILGDIKEKHLPNFVRWFSDKEVTGHLGADFSGLNLKKEKEWYDNVKKTKNLITFGIYAAENKKEIIGSVSLKDIDFHNKRAELGIAIADKEYWGKGIGTEATNLIVGFAFKTLNLNSIYLIVNSKNKAAQKVYKRAGFKKTGMLRQHMRDKKGFEDVFVMNILKGEHKK